MDGSATVVRWESVGNTYAASDCREHLLSDAGCIKNMLYNRSVGHLCLRCCWSINQCQRRTDISHAKRWCEMLKTVMFFLFFLLFHTFPIPGDLHWDSSPYSGPLSANQCLTDAHCHSCRVTCSWDFGGLHGSTFAVVQNPSPSLCRLSKGKSLHKLTQPREHKLSMNPSWISVQSHIIPLPLPCLSFSLSSLYPGAFAGFLLNGVAQRGGGMRLRRAALENEASSIMPGAGVGDFVDMFWPHVFPQRESSLKNNTKIVSCHHMMKHFDPAGLDWMVWRLCESFAWPLQLPSWVPVGRFWTNMWDPNLSASIKHQIWEYL